MKAQGLPVLDLSYGEGLTYTVRGQCSNCGDQFRVRVLKGRTKPAISLSGRGAICPTCGCHKVSGHELIR